MGRALTALSLALAATVVAATVPEEPCEARLEHMVEFSEQLQAQLDSERQFVATLTEYAEQLSEQVARLEAQVADGARAESRAVLALHRIAKDYGIDVGPYVEPLLPAGHARHTEVTSSESHDVARSLFEQSTLPEDGSLLQHDSESMLCDSGTCTRVQVTTRDNDLADNAGAAEAAGEGEAQVAAGAAAPAATATTRDARGVTRVSSIPRVFFAPDFLSEEEIVHLVRISEPGVVGERGHVAKRDSTGFSYEQPVEGDAVLEGIVRRMEALAGFSNEFGGTLRMRRYGVGDSHPRHTDSYTLSGSDTTLVATALLYLSNVTRGGETVFPRAQPQPVRLTPTRGALGLWFSCDESGEEDVFSEHEGMRVDQGRKWTATYFIYSSRRTEHCAEAHIARTLPAA